MSEPTSLEELQNASEWTAHNIRQLMTETYHENHNPSVLTVPEREELIDIIAQVLPAGNVTSFVLSSVLNLKGREISPNEARSHIGSLLKGLTVVRNNAFYSMMFAGPATVLAGYNMLLRLAGVHSDDFLPEGVWQFYTEFGLREDFARHQSETLGFQQACGHLSEAEKLAAWLLAINWLLREYHHLLASEWEERARLAVIEERTGLSGLHRAWQKVIPYSLPAGEQNLITYRRQRFERFCRHHLGSVGVEQRMSFETVWHDPTEMHRRKEAQAAYVRQLSILAYLEPGEYSERRVPIAKTEACIGVIYQRCYFLVPLIDTTHPSAPEAAYQQAQAILNGSGYPAEIDLTLVRVPRAEQADIRRRLNTDQQQALEALRHAPVLINWDETPRNQPLSTLREGQRGVGDHAMTVFRTDASTVFDFSHIFFDGPWAMAVAEMLTGAAVRAAHAYPIPLLHTDIEPLTALDLTTPQPLVKKAQKRMVRTPSISAEDSLSLMPMMELRKLLVNRTNGVSLTINDLLLLYRSIFNQVYTPSPYIREAVEGLRQGRGIHPLAQAIVDEWRSRPSTNPSIMIPMDAGHTNPRDRIFPSIFRSPLTDFYHQHAQMCEMLNTIQATNRKQVQAIFHHARADYLSTLKAFGLVTKRYREIAMQGESTSTTAIRLIAGLPGAMQRVADGIPGQFTFMNEALKGEEVFSNVGQVVAGSSLSRFASAKDDNDKKVLVWGILTDNEFNLHVTLRDFRPPILALALGGYPDLAHAVTQDFLSGYVQGLAQFIDEIQSIITAPRF